MEDRVQEAAQTAVGLITGYGFSGIGATVIAVLSEFGVETTSFVALVGTVGLALQGTLSNVAAGDYIEAGGQGGTVKSLTLFFTELATPGNIYVVVPNGAIWGGTIMNYSRNELRWVDWTLGVAYEADIDQAMALVADLLAKDERVLAEPEGLVAVAELADNSVNLVVRAWCAAGDYSGLKFGLNKAFKQACDEAGISIPYPQLTVHKG